MIKHLLLLGTALFLLAGCAPRFATSHYDRWAKDDLARRSENPVSAPAAAGLERPGTRPTSAAEPAPAPEVRTPAPEGSSGYPDASSSGTNTPDASSSDGRVVKPEEEDEVLY